MAVPFRTAALMVLFVFPICAFAQDSNQDPLDEEAARVLAPITVTGSRIKRIDIEGPMPVAVFDRIELEQAGVNTLEEFMRNLPLNWGPLADYLGMQSVGKLGNASFDLRGIGEEATLTLVNGRRIAPFPRFEAAAIDTNSIPISAIERIEVLKDGASAIYGAEAVAGVVNIILRTGYDGIEVGGGFGITEYGDNEEWLADFVTGTDDGQRSLMLALSWYERDPVSSRDRAFADSGDFRDIGGPARGSSRGSPPTILRYDTISWEADPECGTNPLESWVDEFRVGSGCTFNYPQYTGLIAGIERIGAMLSGRYEIKANLSLFGDALYTDVDSMNHMAPAPIAGSPLVETWTGLPFVAADHPNNPFGTDGELRARPLDLGNRDFERSARTYRIVTGLEGLWGNWDWTAAGLFSESEVTDLDLNMVRQTRFQQALLGQGGPNGNLYYNPFGYRPQNDPALLDWLKTTALAKGKSRVYGLDFDFSRLFGNLPGGPAGVAAGLEWRKQELNQWYDENSLSGDLAGSGIGAGAAPVTASRAVGSAFVEFSLPLYRTLEAQLAARYDDYDDFGSSTNPKLALRWQPVDWLMLRGSYSTSFNPPSFHELGQPPTTGIVMLRDEVRCSYTGQPEDCDLWEYPETLSGNPNLKPEDGTSWFAGVLWEPAFLQGFSLQLDWWKFRHKNRIIWRQPQQVLNEGGDDGIVREPAGPDGTPGRIISVHSTYINTARLDTEGFDTTLRYIWDTDRAGRFTASLLHTYTSRYQFTDSGNAWIDAQGNFAGKWAFDPVPRNRANVNLSWSRGPHGAAANVRYVGHYENFEKMWVNGVETDQPLVVSSLTTLDLQYSYLFERLRGARLRIGCINCTGEEPPLTYFPDPDSYHDPRGRVYYIRWQQPFR